MFRSRKKKSKEISIYEPVGNDSEGNEIHLLDLLESHDPDVIDRLTLHENSRRLYQYFHCALTLREKKVICMRYGLFDCQEMTQKEIAAQLHISRSYVSRIEKKALEKLSTCFERDASLRKAETAL